MKIVVYQIDAFADKIFEGNPAAVAFLDEWLPDEVLQNIAMENNLSETAFFTAEEEGYRIRWFTPLAEVDLCGHATLASAFVIFEILRPEEDMILFHSRSGELKVKRMEGLIELDFPVSDICRCETPPEIVEAFGKEPVEVWRGDDYMAVFDEEADIVSLSPDFNILSKLECRGVIATSPGVKTDFVSRFFAPRLGIDEDPVTGSAHCALMPYWAKRLGKNRLCAAQLSKRGGKLQCELKGDRVLIAGSAVKYLEGTIEI